MGKLRAKTGLSTFDLPTEAQWEYACRAGTGTALSSGYNLTSTGSDPRMAEVGRYAYNGGSSWTQNGNTSVGTAKVGSYLPNSWGLYDMHGNVWEWCLDWYGMLSGSVTNPTGVASGSFRLLRGGSFDCYAWNCRSAAREGSNVQSYKYVNMGFRVAAVPFVDTSANVLVADSERDFSSTQGYRGWYYGYRDSSVLNK